MLANEHIVLTSPISIKTSSLPSFLAPAPKRRQLILTDLPRLMAVKDGSGPASEEFSSSAASGAHGWSVKSEYVFARPDKRGTSASPMDKGHAQGAPGQGRDGLSVAEQASVLAAAGVNRVVDVLDKGAKGFVLQTVSWADHHYDNGYRVLGKRASRTVDLAGLG